MATMTLRLNDDDAEMVRRFAQFEGKTLSEFIRDTVFDKIEDAHDLAALRKAMADDDGVRLTHDEVKRELGL